MPKRLMIITLVLKSFYQHLLFHFRSQKIHLWKPALLHAYLPQHSLFRAVSQPHFHSFRTTFVKVYYSAHTSSFFNKIILK